MKKISSAHLLLVILLVLQTVFSLVVGLTHLSLPVVPALLASQLMLILPFGVYCIATRQNPLKLIRFKKISGGTVAMALLVILFSYPVVMVLNMISMLFVDNAMMNVMPSTLSLGLPLALLLMAVVPAVVEETVFRGTIYNTYSRRKPLAGIFLSALVFGLMHMNFNQMPYAIYLGIVMAFMVEASDSIVTSMLMHFTINGVSTVISFFSMKILSGFSGGAAELSDAYGELLKESGLSDQLGGDASGLLSDTLSPELLRQMLGSLILIAVVCLVIVAALIYVTFIINHRQPKAILLARHEDTAMVAGLKGRMRKNRMIDIFLVIFIIYTLSQCILSAVFV